MEKNKVIILILAAFVISLIMFSAGLIIGSNQKEEKLAKEQNKPVTIVPTQNDDKIVESQLTSEQNSIYDIFMKYGKEIYNNNKYDELSKDGETPYASLNDLKKLGYDVSNIENKCASHSPAIYFDIKHQFSAEYTAEPIQIILDCYQLK